MLACSAVDCGLCNWEAIDGVRRSAEEWQEASGRLTPGDSHSKNASAWSGIHRRRRSSHWIAQEQQVSSVGVCCEVEDLWDAL